MRGGRDPDGLGVTETAESSNPALARTAAAGSEPAAPIGAALTAGTIIAGRYRIERLVGRGGMGAVYAAHDTVADHPVAVKLVGGRHTASERERLREELRAMMRLTHRNIARTYTLEEVDDDVFIVMELLEGQTLAARIAKGPIPRAETLAILMQLLDALAEAHRHKIVHRDVKPANIMCCSDWRLVLMDFGIAKIDDGDAGTHSTSIKGTPAYMAPEVVAGRRADVRSDIYAVGLILFEMLTGEPPFKATSVDELFHKQLNESIDTRKLDDVTATVIAKATAKDPRDRHASIDELRAALNAPAARRLRRLPLGVISLGSLALLLGVALVYVALFRTTGPTRLEIPTKTVPVTDLRPRFEWPQASGELFRVVLWKFPFGREKEVVGDYRNFAAKSWRPTTDLDYLTRYELFVYDERERIVDSWRFTPIEPPRVILPAPETKSIRNVMPEIRVAQLRDPLAYYSFELSPTRTFETILDSAFLGPTEALRHYPGADKELETPDDVRFVTWTANRVLESGKTYVYRIRGYHFRASDVQAGVVPEKQLATNVSETILEAKIAAQAGFSSLTNTAPAIRSAVGSCMPAISAKSELAVVVPEDSGTEIRVIGSTIVDGKLTFDTGQEELTKTVQGSRDEYPVWDGTGEGLYFRSNRTNNTFNAWYKRRDSRGYTQVTSMPRDVGAIDAAKNNERVYFGVDASPDRPGEILGVTPDGKSVPGSLGAGEQPRLSPNMKRILFVQRDGSGVKQLWLMDVNGGNRVQLTNDPFDNEHPAWFPDGKRLVFVSYRSGNADLWMLDVDGARMTQLTNSLAPDLFPAVSPDGHTVLWCVKMPSSDGKSREYVWMGNL